MMKIKAQSLVEFAVILMCVTCVAVISLSLISNKINGSNDEQSNISTEDVSTQSLSKDEEACKKMGLSWDKLNGVCEAK